MDSRIGLDYIVENAEYTTKLGAGKKNFIQSFFSCEKNVFITFFYWALNELFFLFWFATSCYRFWAELVVKKNLFTYIMHNCSGFVYGFLGFGS